jgi:hypothetical protein
MCRKVLALVTSLLALAAAPRAEAAAYAFVEAYNVLDTNNAPSIGANYAATAGQERDIGVDEARGIIYMARGTTTTADGRSVVGIAAIVVTNGARLGSNFRDTGLITATNTGPGLGFCQSLAYDLVSDKVWVLGAPIGANPNIFSAPGGTLGGSPDGDNVGAQNGALVREFQVDDIGRGGTPRGLAVRTAGGVTTVYLAMGSHVQAWSNDQDTQGGTTSAWRRVWATLHPPTQGTVSTRVAANFSGVNGIAVDEAGNCYFNVLATTPGRVWVVRPDFVQFAADPMALDFNDTTLGGTNEKDILPLRLVTSSAAPITNSPQAVTYARVDGRPTLFVSYIPGALQRAVTRLEVDSGLSYLDGNPYVRATVIDGFGSGMPAAGQDPVLASQRLKVTGTVTQPAGASNGLLYHDVNNPTNATHIYVVSFVTNYNIGQTIAVAGVNKVTIPIDTNPPSITVQPANQTLLEGGGINLSVAASGAQPLFYQWYSNSVSIANATNASYSVRPATTNDGGLYHVVITNHLGSRTSTQAVVTVNPLVRSEAMTLLWSVAPGARHFLTTDNTQRGLAYNAEGNNVIVVSRSPSNAVYLLDAETGATLEGDPGQPLVLPLGPNVSGGTFPINVAGASDDGKVYVSNLADGTATDFRIYRWDFAPTDVPAEIAYSGKPTSGIANRWGDTMDVRGSGNNIQIIVGARSSKWVTIFTTENGGMTFTAHPIEVSEAPNGAFGLGVAFGQGNTFWGKGDSSTALRLVQFDLATSNATVLRVYGSSTYYLGATAIGVEPSLGVLGAVSIENPDNLRLYNINNLDSGPFLVDQELFPTDSDNINGTGAVDFGDGRIYALDSNNGILALTLGNIPQPPPNRITITRNPGSVTLTWQGTATLQAADVVTGPYTDVPGATSGYTENTTGAARFFRLRN